MQAIALGACAALLATQVAAARRLSAVRVDLVRVDQARLEQELLGPTDRPRLLHVWTSWCGPCRAELPLLSKALRLRKRRGIEVTMLALDEPSAEPELRRLVARAGALVGKLRVVLPAQALPVMLRIDPAWDGSVPASYLLDAHGALVFAQRGLSIVPELMQEIDHLLGTE